MSGPTLEPNHTKVSLPRGRFRKRLALGCLLPSMVLCAALGLLTTAVLGGPVELNLPGGGAVRLGHDDFVLSNYSFQNGTTYYLDLAGADVRDILELHVLSDTHRIELVLNHATKQEQKENHLMDMPAP